MINLWSLSHTPFHTLLIQLPIQRWGSHTLSSAVSQNTGFSTLCHQLSARTRGFPAPCHQMSYTARGFYILSSAVHSTRLSRLSHPVISCPLHEATTPCHQLSIARGYHPISSHVIHSARLPHLSSAVHSTRLPYPVISCP